MIRYKGVASYPLSFLRLQDFPILNIMHEKLGGGAWGQTGGVDLSVGTRIEGRSKSRVLKSLIGQLLLVILTIMKFAALVRTKANDIHCWFHWKNYFHRCPPGPTQLQCGEGEVPGVHQHSYVGGVGWCWSSSLCSLVYSRLGAHIFCTCVCTHFHLYDLTW